MMVRMHFKNRKDWLAARPFVLGASEAAAVVGDSKFQTRAQLWEVKTGKTRAPDLSANEAVQRGVRMEGALRGWFAANHPEFKIYHHPYDMLCQKERTWLIATLDGEFVHRETGFFIFFCLKNFTHLSPHSLFFHYLCSVNAIEC